MFQTTPYFPHVASHESMWAIKSIQHFVGVKKKKKKVSHLTQHLIDHLIDARSHMKPLRCGVELNEAINQKQGKGTLQYITTDK